MKIQKLLLTITVTGSALHLLTTTAFAQNTGQPNELQAIYACKLIPNPDKRLACYDNTVGLFEAAEKSGEVVTVSKTAVEKVERDAFGFNIPSLPSLGRLFGGKNKTLAVDKKPKANPLTAAVAPPSAQSAELKPTHENSKLTKPVRPVTSKVTEVTLDIRKTTEFGYKKTRFFMSNGQVWEQADSLKVRIPKVRNGKKNTAEISKAALGSFFLRINGKGSSIRVKRVR